MNKEDILVLLILYRKIRSAGELVDSVLQCTKYVLSFNKFPVFCFMVLYWANKGAAWIFL